MTASSELLSSVERRALDAIDLDGLIEALCELIGFQSLGGQESAAQERIAAMMSEAGMEVDAWELDLETLYRDRACTVEIERSEALGVVGRAGGGGGGGGRCLVLNGHVDVVPAGELERWSVPPWQGTVHDGRVYGRGAADMKGGLCCALFAIRAIREAGVATAGPALLHCVVSGAPMRLTSGSRSPISPPSPVPWWSRSCASVASHRLEPTWRGEHRQAPEPPGPPAGPKATP